MSIRVAITGMGIVSAIGNSVAENFDSLQNGKIGIGKISLFETRHQNEILVGEVKLSNTMLEKILQLPPSHNYTRTALLGAYAVKQALQQAKITDCNNRLTAFISSTSVGGMDFTEKYFYEYLENPEIERFITSHDAGHSSHEIANLIGLEGLVTTISTACSSAANAIMLGSRLIKSGRAQRVIVGGSDALSKFTINGFKTLMILSDTYNTPFDDNRKGLNLGEAAAYLVLEAEEVAKADGKDILAYVAGYGNANDAFHQTASSENGEGAFLAMEKALKVANLKPDAIDYINAHGTATPNNDLSEGRAILRVFTNHVPAFSSTKAFTGHTLAAAAAIEAVYSVLAIQHQCIYPNLNFKTPMQEFHLLPETKFKSAKINTVLSNSFGFGGNCSTIIFTK